jgi:hypothetical protein
MHRRLESDAWLVKYEKFLRSPVWKLVSDEAMRKAHFKCECWGCTGHATRVHLLELPEEHLEPNFDWMNRNNILIALCHHHYEMIHRFVRKRVVALDRQLDSRAPSGFLSVLTGSARRPVSAGLSPAQTKLP